MLTSLLEGVVYMALRVGAVMLVLPIFALPALAVVVVGGWISMIYTHAQLSVKRELSNARAPVLGHFAGALAGLGESPLPLSPMLSWTAADDECG